MHILTSSGSSVSSSTPIELDGQTATQVPHWMQRSASMTPACSSQNQVLPGGSADPVHLVADPVGLHPTASPCLGVEGFLAAALLVAARFLAAGFLGAGRFAVRVTGVPVPSAARVTRRSSLGTRRAQL